VRYLLLNFDKLVAEQLLVRLFVVHQLHECLGVVLGDLLRVLVEVRPLVEVLEDVGITDC